MKNITAKRSRARIVDKLLALGLVAERRELYKKRRKKLAPSSLVTVFPWLCQLGVPPSHPSPPAVLLRSSPPRFFLPQALLNRPPQCGSQEPRTPRSSLSCLLWSISHPNELEPDEEESLHDFCQEDLDEEENVPEKEDEEDEEEEGGSEAEQAQAGSVLSAECLGQSLHQEGEGLVGRGVSDGRVGRVDQP